MSKTDEKVSTEEQKPSLIGGVSCRAFVLERAKKHLGNRFRHFGTGTILTGENFTWSVQVAKCFGGMHVSYGGWVVWSACGGWSAEPCN